MAVRKDELVWLLADPTRLGIYKQVMKSRETGMTTNEIASKFNLHPNVARTHLEKLARVGLLDSEYQKSNGSGRPARIYRLGSQVASTTFPPRDYEMLADLAISALEQGEDIQVLARERGRQLGQEHLEKSGLTQDSPREKLSEDLRQMTEDAGLLTEFEPGKKGLEVRVYNCVFKELSSKHVDLICKVHQQMFIGLCESHFGKVDVASQSDIAGGGSHCSFQIKLR